MRGHHDPMAFQEFIMLWQERLKMFFVVIKHLKALG